MVQWLEYPTLDGYIGADSRFGTLFSRLYNSQTAVTSRARCGVIDSSFSFTSSVDTHFRLFVDNQHSPGRAPAVNHCVIEFVLVCDIAPGGDLESFTMARRDVYVRIRPGCFTLGGCTGSDSQLEVPPVTARLAIAKAVHKYDGPPSLSEVEWNGRLRWAYIGQ